MSPDDGNRLDDPAFFNLSVSAGLKDTTVAFEIRVHTTREIFEDVLNTPQTEVVKVFGKVINILQGRE